MEFTGERYMPNASGVSEEMSIEHLHRYHAIKELVRDRRVLDVACGEGYGSNILAAGASEVHGLDISPEAVGHASSNYQRPNLKFGVSSVAKLPFPDAT